MTCQIGTFLVQKDEHVLLIRSLDFNSHAVNVIKVMNVVTVSADPVSNNAPFIVQHEQLHTFVAS